MKHRTAPRILHAVAGYIIVAHEGAPTDYFREGDPVIADSLGWYYWPEGLPENYGRNAAHSQYTAWAANASVPDVDGARVGALLADVTIPEVVRAAFEAEGDEATAGDLLNDWMDTVEWDESWISPAVTVVKMTDAFRENRERIIARRTEMEARA